MGVPLPQDESMLRQAFDAERMMAAKEELE
jgi:hypothetical protein